MTTKLRKFLFENSFGNFYEVALDEKAGTGKARLLGKTISGSTKVGAPMTSFAFDPETVRGRHESALYHSPIFGPTHNQALNAILNAS